MLPARQPCPPQRSWGAGGQQWRRDSPWSPGLASPPPSRWSGAGGGQNGESAWVPTPGPSIEGALSSFSPSHSALSCRCRRPPRRPPHEAPLLPGRTGAYLGLPQRSQVLLGSSAAGPVLSTAKAAAARGKGARPRRRPGRRLPRQDGLLGGEDQVPAGAGEGSWGAGVTRPETQACTQHTWGHACRGRACSEAGTRAQHRPWLTHPLEVSLRCPPPPRRSAPHPFLGSGQICALSPQPHSLPTEPAGDDSPGPFMCHQHSREGPVLPHQPGF